MDERPDLFATLDQARAALRDVALVVGYYRRQLIAAGVPAEQALELCLDLQRVVIVEDLG